MSLHHILTVFAMAAALGGVLGATTALKLDVDTMTDKADVVVIARLESKEAKWDAGKKGIWTHHEITVSETMKGDHEKDREFVTRGGVVGRVGQHVAGSGQFDVDEEYVLFLWQDSKDRLRLVGMVQGAFKVKDDNAKNSTSGLTIVDAETLKPVENDAASGALEYDLDVLKKRVKKSVKAAREDE